MGMVDTGHKREGDVRRVLGAISAAALLRETTEVKRSSLGVETVLVGRGVVNAGALNGREWGSRSVGNAEFAGVFADGDEKEFSRSLRGRLLIMGCLSSCMPDTGSSSRSTADISVSISDSHIWNCFLACSRAPTEGEAQVDIDRSGKLANDAALMPGESNPIASLVIPGTPRRPEADVNVWADGDDVSADANHP